MSGTVRKFFNFNLVILRWVGLYPPRHYQIMYKLYGNLLYRCCTLPVLILAVVHLFAKNNINLEQISDSCFMIFQVGCFSFKLLPFMHKPEEIRMSIYMMEQQIFQTCNQQEDRFVTRCMKICKINSWLFIGFCVAAAVAWAIAPLVSSKNDFPIEIWVPFNPVSSPVIHTAVYIFVLIGVINGAIANGALDPMVASLICFASYQFRVLKGKLQHLSKYAEEKLKVHDYRKLDQMERIILKNDMAFDIIKNCIEHHKAIFDFVQNFEDNFSSVVFAQFAASVLVICVSCVRLSLIEPFTFAFYSMIIFISTMLLEIFLYSYFGTSLFEESSSLTTAVYMGNWYEYSLECRKALIILMERSKKPLFLTAGKIVVISLETFTTILRRAYSLFAVLRNYN